MWKPPKKPSWRPARLTGDQAFLHDVTYYRIDDGQAIYWTPWENGCLIPDFDFCIKVRNAAQAR